MAKRRVVFLHPDLGVGGAERLVVDAALSLKNRDYEVSFVTSHHDKTHCFQETKDGTLPVTVIGDFMPRQIFGRFYALCAYLRMFLCSLYVAVFLSPDIVFCDLISICIPILHLRVPKVVFYCHFPDQLLSRKEGFLKQIYRWPLNWLEERTTKSADKIFVNSNFTKSVFTKTFPSISSSPDILYPSINTSSFDKNSGKLSRTHFLQLYGFPSDAFIFLSINRYERKKNVELAIKSLCCLKHSLPRSDWNRISLIVAGGYDNRVVENVGYFNELKKIAANLQIADKITFLKSPSDSEKINLLTNCDCLLYSPSNEHFGIVPLEAMYSSKPVIAVNSGGPTETIINNETGFLCEPSEYDFSKAMISLIQNKDLCVQMGSKGKQRFTEKFSYQAFGESLNKSLENLCNV